MYVRVSWFVFKLCSVLCTLLTTITPMPCNYPFGVFFSWFGLVWYTSVVNDGPFCTLRAMILESGNLRLYVQSTVKHHHH